MTTRFSRRHMVQMLGLGAGGLAAAGALPGISWAAGPAGGLNRKLVFIIQRGAADGLALVPSLGDPALAGLRGALQTGEQPAQRLDALFGLHSAFDRVGQMFASGEAAAVHAVATAYRDRSHFDGQNLLESGGRAPYARKDGWLNRLLALVPPDNRRALGVAAAVPMALRGDNPASNYAPSRMPSADEDLLMRLSALYTADPQLDPIWQQALSTRALASDIGGNNGRNGAQLGELAARLLSGKDGAGMVMLETGGWDTHSAQQRRLTAQVRGLDALIGALRDGLADIWGQTLVLVATEFGRTAAANGTGGTDHGTASVLMMFGGTLSQGGRVRADWPGLASANLYQGRDLRPTASLEGEISRAVAAHYRLDAAATRRALYPDLV